MTGGPPIVLAADIGGTTTRVAAVQGERILRRLEAPTPAAHGPEAVGAALLELLAGLNLEAGDLNAQTPLGVACTGRVVNGVVSAVNLRTMPGWTGIPLAARLSSELGRPVAVLNDARAAAWAEWRAAPTTGHFLFVTVSTGIGSGLVLGGRLVAADVGDTGLGDTGLGDTALGDTGLGFTRGLGGEALELGSSGTALSALAARQGYESAAALFDAAEANDGRARDLLAAPLAALGDRLSDLHAVLGLNVVCLGGSVGLRNFTRRAIAARLPGTRVCAARYGADAGLMGAAYCALEHCVPENGAVPEDHP